MVTASRFKLDVEASIRDIEKLRGNTWLLFGDHRATATDDGKHPSLIIDRLRDMGYTILSEKVFTGASVYQIGENTK